MAPSILIFAFYPINSQSISSQQVIFLQFLPQIILKNLFKYLQDKFEKLHEEQNKKEEKKNYQQEYLSWLWRQVTVTELEEKKPEHKVM